MLEITISDDFSQAGVPVALGCIECRVRVVQSEPALDHALAEAVAEWEGRLAKTPLAQIPEIAAARRAYKALGKDPSRYRISSEALLRRIRQGKGLHRVNSLVDTNNLVSLGSALSVGAYRAEALALPVAFRKGRPGESYRAIGRGPLNLENLPLFADARGPFGSPTSDSERTMITPETERVLMVLIAFGEAPGLEQHVAWAADCLERYGRASDIETAIVAS